MNTAILNRAGKLPEDGWHQIEVPGEHVNHEAKVVQVIDAKAIESILNRFKVDAAKENFAGLLIDQEHFSLDPDKSTEAMGWALELRKRDGIPEARIDWTAAGRPKVEGKDYKFFSTVYDVKDCEVLSDRIVNGKKYKVVRPLRLDRLALTNDPNNKGGKPISNRDANPGDAAETKNQPKMKNIMKLLGLAEDASEDSAVTAIQAIQNRVTKAEGSVTTLTSERDALLKDQVEADLEKYKNRFKPENKEKVREQLVKNRAGTIALLEVTEPAAAAERERITNRAGARQPDETAANDAAERETKRTAAVEDYKVKNRCSFDEAWKAVRRTQPDLFKE